LQCISVKISQYEISKTDRIILNAISLGIKSHILLPSNIFITLSPSYQQNIYTMALLGNLSNYKNLGLLIIRIGLGIMFIYHGYPKLMGGTQNWKDIGESMKYVGIHFWPVVWGLLAAVTECFGGFLLIIGLAFRPVCILMLINLIVAALMHLGTGDGLGGAAHAIEDAVTFAGLIFIGPGKYSVDKK